MVSPIITHSYAQLPSGFLSDITDYTIAFWVNLDSYASWQRLFDFGVSDSQYMFLAPSNGTSASSSMVYGIRRPGYNEQTISTTTPFKLNRWTHVAVTQEGDTVTIYIDGAPYITMGGMTNNPSNTLGANTQNYIGRSQFASDAYLRAALDDFRMYDYALDPMEVYNMMSLLNPRTVVSIGEPLNYTTKMGLLPELPKTFAVTYDDGSTEDTVVQWLNTDVMQTINEKEFVIYGRIGGTNLRAEARITVESLSVDEDYAINIDVEPPTATSDGKVTFDVKNFTVEGRSVNLVAEFYDRDDSYIAESSITETITLEANGYIYRESIEIPLPEGVNYRDVILKGYVTDEESNRLSDSSDILEEIIDSFSIPNQNDIRGNITLPDNINDVQVKWSSSDEDIVSTALVENEGYDPTPPGVVTRDVTEDKNVTLTGTFTLNEATIIVEYDVTVTQKPEMERLEKYLLAGFANLSQDIQQIHFSLSEDGNFYSDMLNDGAPVITSSMGTLGLRDPHIVRSPDGDKFYLIATDLDARGGAWGEYSTNGSLSIMIWESTDLVNWSDQRMIKIAPDDAGNCWAPESIYDPITGEYIVFWSSRNRETGNGHWIRYAKTRDFITFTESEVYTKNNDTGIIDSTIIYNDIDEYYYRFTKWEYAVPSLGVQRSSIYVERAKQLLHTDWEWVNGRPSMIVSGGYEGPAIFKYNNEDKWGLMVDEYSAGQQRRFIPMWTNDLASGQFQFPEAGTYQMPTDRRACHGVVLPITQKEYDAIAEKWGTPVYQNRPY